MIGLRGHAVNPRHAAATCVRYDRSYESHVNKVLPDRVPNLNSGLTSWESDKRKMNTPWERAMRQIAAGPRHRLAAAADATAGSRPGTGRALPLEWLA